MYYLLSLVKIYVSKKTFGQYFKSKYISKPSSSKRNSYTTFVLGCKFIYKFTVN